MASVSIEAFLERHRLSSDFADLAASHYAPLADRVRAAARRRRPFVLGVSGAQGSGKTVLADYLAVRLAAEPEMRTAVLSLDDLYLPRAERLGLARDVHPLLATRGVPGTHDVALGLATFRELARPGGPPVALPRFDKARDDRCDRRDWPLVEPPVDIVVFEGWCVGATAEPDERLERPLNELERRDDPDGRWRRYVNRCLQRDYPPLFANVDALVFLRVPDFTAVGRWRREQERKLRDTRGAGGMSDSELHRFIEHFERITRWNLEALALRADAVFDLDADHGIAASRIGGRLG